MIQKKESTFTRVSRLLITDLAETIMQVHLGIYVNEARPFRLSRKLARTRPCCARHTLRVGTKVRGVSSLAGGPTIGHSVQFFEIPGGSAKALFCAIVEARNIYCINKFCARDRHNVKAVEQGVALNRVF